jgi:hypothetical protein
MDHVQPGIADSLQTSTEFRIDLETRQPRVFRQPFENLPGHRSGSSSELDNLQAPADLFGHLPRERPAALNQGPELLGM